MLCCRAKGSTPSRILGGRYWCSKERSCSQRTLNLASLSAKNKLTTDGMILVLRNIFVIVLDLLLVLLSKTNIVLQRYHFLIYQSLTI